MASPNLKGVRVAILVTDDFEESELLQPRQALSEAGAETAVVSPKNGQLQAMRHDEKTVKIGVDLELDAARPENFDAVFLPGGALNADHLRIDKRAQAFVREFDRANKPIAVICHGPWLLVSSGLVHGRTLTGYHTIQDDIRNAGGNWRDHEVIRDRNWVSSRQPSDIPAFNREMLKLFSEQSGRERRAA